MHLGTCSDLQHAGGHKAAGVLDRLTHNGAVEVAPRGSLLVRRTIVHDGDLLLRGAPEQQGLVLSSAR